MGCSGREDAGAPVLVPPSPLWWHPALGVPRPLGDPLTFRSGQRWLVLVHLEDFVGLRVCNHSPAQSCDTQAYPHDFVSLEISPRKTTSPRCSYTVNGESESMKGRGEGREEASLRCRAGEEHLGERERRGRHGRAGGAVEATSTLGSSLTPGWCRGHLGYI